MRFPNTPDNVVRACRSWNSSKGMRGLYQWFGLERCEELPGVAEGKYLKLLYRLKGGELWMRGIKSSAGYASEEKVSSLSGEHSEEEER